MASIPILSRQPMEAADLFMGPGRTFGLSDDLDHCVSFPPETRALIHCVWESMGIIGFIMYMASTRCRDMLYLQGGCEYMHPITVCCVGTVVRLFTARILGLGM